MIAKMNIGMALTGHYVVERKRRNGDVVECLEFDNLVLDVGWDEMESRLSQDSQGIYTPNYLYLGTGSTEPQPTDQGLESVSGTLPGKLENTTTYSKGRSSEDSTFYHQVEQVFEYTEGEAEGVWSELGLAFGDAYSLPYNRSLFRDESGSAVSLTILSDEHLTVTVRLRMYFKHVRNSDSFLYNGQSEGLEWFLTHSESSDESHFTSVWSRGLPGEFFYVSSSFGLDTAGLISNVSFTNTDTAETVTYYDANLSAQADYYLGPGEEETFYGLAVCLTGGSFDTQSIVLLVIFDQPIVKASDEKITGSITVQFSRDTALLA